MGVVCEQALQSLGCNHVLEAYLQGITVEGFADVESVREIQYESACQNGKWDLELATRYCLFFSLISHELLIVCDCMCFLLMFIGSAKTV